MGEKQKNIGEIKVSEFMIEAPFYTTPNKKISTTELLMLKKKIGSLPINDNNKQKQVIGIISQRDISLARFNFSLESPSTIVSDLILQTRSL